MRICFICLLICLTSEFCISQNVGIGTNTPEPSAAFEIKDTSRGFLPPRMTYEQRNRINNPVQGLIVYCTDCGENGGEPQYFNGTAWLNLIGGIAKTGPINIPSVTIGTQVWSLKNLDVATYRNGDPIPQVSDSATWFNLTTGAWCWYNNDSATYAATYGRMYNWYAVNDPRGLAPVGWHVPSDAEWTTLTNFLGGSSVAGGSMKSTTGWTSPNTGATNSSGFTGLPGGYRYNFSIFSGAEIYAFFWSATEYSGSNAWQRELSWTKSNLARNANFKHNGFSVRLVKD